MRRRAVGRRLVFVVGLGLLVGGIGKAAEPQRQTTQQQAPGSTPSLPPLGGKPGENDPFQARIEDKRIALVETERHKRMLADADKLLRLATELKEDVDKTTKDEMSVPTIMKAAEIEKLAHDVKERMKGQ